MDGADGEPPAAEFYARIVDSYRFSIALLCTLDEFFFMEGAEIVNHGKICIWFVK